MTRTMSRRPPDESQENTGLEHVRSDTAAGLAVRRCTSVGQRRKRKSRSPPSPTSASSSSGPRTHQGGKRALRTETTLSVRVPLKEEAAVVTASAAAGTGAAAGGAATTVVAPSMATFSPMVFPSRQTATARVESSSCDPEDRVKAEVTVA